MIMKNILNNSYYLLLFYFKYSIFFFLGIQYIHIFICIYVFILQPWNIFGIIIFMRNYYNKSYKVVRETNNKV